MRVRRTDTLEEIEVPFDQAFRMLKDGVATPVVDTPPVERAVAPVSEHR